MPATMNPQHAALFATELLQGETLLWTGQPSLRRRLYGIDISILLCGLMILIFGATIVLAGFLTEGLLVADVFSVIILAMSLYLCIGRFVVRARLKRRTYYALTDRRALIFSDRRNRSLEISWLDRVPVIRRRIGRRGVGNIYFGNAPPFLGGYRNTGMETLDTWFGGGPPAFVDVEEADRVYAQIETARRGQTVGHAAHG